MMVDPDTAVEEKPADDFDAAFAAFAVGKDAPAAEPEESAGDEPGEEGAGDPGDGDAAPADGGGDGDDTDPPADGGDGEPPADGGSDDGGSGDEPPPAEDKATDELIERLASLVKEAPKKEAHAAETPEEKPEELPELYTTDETEFLKKYDEDWSDVAKGEALKRKAEYRELVGYVFQQVADQFRPIMETVELLSARTQLADLRGKVEDYDTIRDKVVTWVEEQPAYLQTGMKQVIQAGTVDEVADLISRYRQATGDTAKIPPKTAKKSDELSDAAKKAAEALAPVSTKRSVIPQQDDPNDFDSAFAKFAAKQ